MSRRFWIVTAFVLSASAQQAIPTDPLPPGVYRPGRGVIPPSIAERREPKFTEEALIAKLEGSVLVSLIVDEAGAVRDMRVRRSLGLGLDEQALGTIQAWRFQPGTKDGQPVAVAVNVEVFFKTLRDAREWRLQGVEFATQDGATRPRLSKAMYPAPSGVEETAAVTVSFDVSEAGVPVKIAVKKASDSKWIDDVIKLVREWRFHPSTKDGKPLAASCTMFFVRGSHSPTPPPRLGSEQ
jgi:TonB family protein